MTMKTGIYLLMICWILLTGADLNGQYPGNFNLQVVEEFSVGSQVGTLRAVPVDLNGDGYHEFACAQGEQSDRKVYAFSGNVIGYLGENAFIAMASKFMDLPGEQLLCYYPDGRIRIWADRNARDSRIAIHRYNSPYYKIAQSLTATGYNLINPGGL